MDWRIEGSLKIKILSYGDKLVDWGTLIKMKDWRIPQNSARGLHRQSACWETRPETQQYSLGWLGRSSNSKTTWNSKMWRTDLPTNLPTNPARCRVACPWLKTVSRSTWRMSLDSHKTDFCLWLRLRLPNAIKRMLHRFEQVYEDLWRE